LICFYVLHSFSHPATIFNKLELSLVELTMETDKTEHLSKTW